MQNEKFKTSQFCAPIYLTNKFGHFFAKSAAFLSSSGALPDIGNATLTFVEYEGKIYGITCRHVVKILNGFRASPDLLYLL
jgi:hypothetical protein